MINDTLHDILNEYIIAYLNDILIFIDEELEKHKEYVKRVLSRLIFRNLRIKMKKCEFHKKEIFFLEHIVEINEIRMDSKKIEAIANWPISETIKKIQGFLGFANFNKYFIEKYSHKAESLTRLTRQNQRFD